MYRLIDRSQKSRLVGNLAGALKVVPRFIQVRQIGQFCKADPDYGGHVAEGLGVKIDDTIGETA